MKILRKFFPIFAIVLLAISGAIFYCNFTIEKVAQPFVFSEITKIPANKIGLVLGTSKTLENGYPNLYFTYRMEATKKLYDAGKIQYIIVSGDNSKKQYNEPQDMKEALVQLGIPENIIYEDFAGLRTLDSVIRAKEIFGQDSYTIISQEFHNERAVFLARKSGIQAIAYNAEDVDKFFGLKTQLREYLARVKAVVDFNTNKAPKHGGDEIELP